MEKKYFRLGQIPCCVWGKPSDSVYLFVHGKMSKKENAAEFAEIAEPRGFQVLSFDLPGHGEQQGNGRRCDVWNGMRDLAEIGEYARTRWAHRCLFACSLGAFFSLMTYPDEPLEQCLFQSPVVDMEALIRQMFQWFQVTEEQLREKGEIATPMDTLSWDYYTYVREHPVKRWPIPTEILFGSEDALQSQTVMEQFAARFPACRLTIAKGCEHGFLKETEKEAASLWMREHIEAE